MALVDFLEWTMPMELNNDNKKESLIDHLNYP